MYGPATLGDGTLGIDPATASMIGREAFSAIKQLLGGGGAKPLLVPVESVAAVIRDLDQGERAELERRGSPFGWWNRSSLESNAGKIAAELRDAKNSTEVALYEFIVSRLAVEDQPSGESGGQSLGEEIFDDVTDTIIERAGRSKPVRDAAGRIVRYQAASALESMLPMLIVGGAVLMFTRRR